MRRSKVGWTAALVTLAVLAGCGSGHETAATLTKSQIARAQAVCVALERKLHAVSASSKPFSPKIREATRERQRANEQLRAITVPSSQVASEWLHWREAAVADTQAALETKPGSEANTAAGKREYEATEKARALAKSAGLPACARVG
jgi:hypothetical protein